MSRVFTPEEDTFRWSDLENLPRVGELFFSLATILSDEPVSRELDTYVTGKKDEQGVLIEKPVPPGFFPDPLGLLERIAEIKHYRSNRLSLSRRNAVTVSRLSGASAESIYRRPPVEGVTPDQPEHVRKVFRTIHRKMGQGYIGLIDPKYSSKNAQAVGIYDEASRLITGQELGV